MSAEGMSWGCVTGRFQPLHRQHVELFSRAAEQHDGLVVAITNPDPTSMRPEEASAHRHLAEANPFSYFERARMIQVAIGSEVHGRPVTIVPFDLMKPEVWHGYVPVEAVQYVRRRGPWEEEKAARLRAAGYRVVRVEPSAGPDVSATAVRQLLRESPSAPLDDVPPSVAAVLPALVARWHRDAARP